MEFILVTKDIHEVFTFMSKKYPFSCLSTSVNSFKPTRVGITPTVHRSIFDKSRHQPFQAHHHLVAGILHTNMQL
ncbi:hypothetical protein PDN73_29300 [Bacillus cereus]|uniref:hypothetical protein n=1 Tax=Bacillus thuringiensis TaxID=1428 RepID=UPI0015D49FF0|nr:hypothetical protein [Bacillus thuringiensis]MCC2544675.1 hypothetical protein [Bacillus thuringiensis]MCU4998177.1 hypothetical protein [Bacillus cereus]MDA2519843.1 hypothetical protein [Bacillus cereus]